MKAAGVVVEYNPLHRGHVHHLKETRRMTGADVIIAVMSGNFLQRGEPAFMDKWARTETALRSGADLVFELPYRFATAQASEFAEGAIALLSAARCESFCFGSEGGEIVAFQNTVRLLEQDREVYEAEVRRLVRTGMSYPAALNGAYEAVSENAEALGPLADLTQPNNILGYHYMKASRILGTGMAAHTVKRTGSGHNDPAADPATGIMSATAIRKSVLSGSDLPDVKNAIPDATGEAMADWLDMRGGFGNWDSFWPSLRYTVIRSGPEKLSGTAEMTEGLEHRIARAAVASSDFQEFMASVKTKRYTWTRIQRILTHILCGMDKVEYDRYRSPRYLRLLGMTQNGRTYLNRNKENFGLPLISRAAAFSDPMLGTDIRVSDLYALGTGGQPGQEFRTPPVMMD